jgi:hypothetical protein
MKTKIEELLYKKTENSQSRIFHTQWQLAKVYVPEILNVISHIFPHYSLHDRTHSDTIINNIGRIIGIGTIEKLSAIDLWLILCAAYYHDIGMSIFSFDKINIYKSEEFIDMIKNIQSDNRSPLFEYANCFEIKERKIFYKNNELNSISYESARFLMAEFIRKSHSERSKDSIESNISMNLPGSPIPKRIIEVLANICSVHTQSFEKVMELPFSEVGIDVEDCHPRYIASLLRLGDLLDMDSNRFSEVLLQTIDKIPVDSILHKQKHLSIKHIRIDQKRIEAKAVCENYDVADITNRWFSLIDTEMYNQMKNWNDIVPDSTFGFLPTLGELKVYLKGYDTIDGKERPSFKIDPTKSIELLQGAGLYSEPYQSIRELLQNATDATFIRIFVENELNEVENTRERFLGDCEKYPISITIKKEKIVNEKILWSIKIIDEGIGISKEDLEYLTTTGSSIKNHKKKKIIDRMPEWMKPSGTFGIGFQSIFLLSDQVLIKTRKINKEDVLNVELNNPAGKRDGAILIQTNKDDKKKVGTELEFILEVDKNPYNWTISGGQSYTSQVVLSYDFVIDETLDIDIAKILDEINKFSQASYIPIILYFNDEKLILFNKENKIFDYYCKEKEMQLSIYQPDIRSKTFYRNQYVEKSINIFGFLSFYINILKGNAKDILTLNRNEIQLQYKDILCKDIIEAALLILSENYKNLDEDLLPLASMFVEYHAPENIKKLFDKKDLDCWMTYKIGTDLFKKELKEVLEYQTIIFRGKDSTQENISLLEEGKTLIIEHTYDMDIINFIIMKSKYYQISFGSYKNDKDILNSQIILTNDSDIELINDWKLWFWYYKNISYGYARGLMPCNKKYIILKLDDNFNVNWGYDLTFRNFAYKKYSRMICPYIRINKKNNLSFYSNKLLKLDVPDKMIDLVFKHRYDKSVTKEQIIKMYNVFIKDMKGIVKDLNNQEKKKKT